MLPHFPATLDVTKGAPTLLLSLLLLSACKGDGDATAPAETTPAEATPAPSATPTETATPPRERDRDRNAAAAPEVVADLDLAVRLGLVPPEPVVVAPLLTHPDIRELVQYNGELAVRSLDGIAPSANYNALRLAAGEGYGFALQLWRLDETRQVIPRFERLRDTWIVATPDESAVGDAAFHGEFSGIRHYVFSHRPSRSVVAITCQSDLCTTEQSREIARRVLSRL